MNKKTISHSFRVDKVAPVLTNKMYWCVKCGGWAKKATTPELKKFKKLLSGRLKKGEELDGGLLYDVIPTEVSQEFKEAIEDRKHGIDVKTIFYVPFEVYLKLDVSNTIKAFEDSVVLVLGVDDVWTRTYVATKLVSPDGEWHIESKMEVVEFDDNYLKFFALKIEEAKLKKKEAYEKRKELNKKKKKETGDSNGK